MWLQVGTLMDISARLGPGARSPYTTEGTHVRCFQRLVLCKLHNR
jgi:hypothetical protein